MTQHRYRDEDIPLTQEPLLAGLQRLRKMLAHLQPQQQEGQ